ncbi:hypothetical protein [uncultured Tessaracoccus sp.]|uniref:hypothetical protein n=1 Tax=uncultured Tessaracoccus sp. TaxID=905023 RepID=UPI002616DA36|nr:hypothetical protein [uncultured Tessaracoccus sp.]
MTLKDSDQVKTAPLVALGLCGGFAVARESGIRALGGVVLVGAGLYAGRTWLRKGGVGKTMLLTALYVGGFGYSHKLAKKIGAWPSVLAVTAVASGAAHCLVDEQ